MACEGSYRDLAYASETGQNLTYRQSLPNSETCRTTNSNGRRHWVTVAGLSTLATIAWRAWLIWSNEQSRRSCSEITQLFRSGAPHGDTLATHLGGLCERPTARLTDPKISIRT